MGDFRIPSEPSLSVGGVSYGEAISAQRGAAAAARGVTGALSDVTKVLGQAAKSLFAIRNDQLAISAQGDLLEAQRDLNSTATELGYAGKLAPIIGHDEEGIVGVTGYSLGEGWDKKIQEWQTTLSDKYKDYPQLAESVLSQFRQTAVEAQKWALDSAYRRSLESGKNEALNNLSIAVKDGIKTGDTGGVDRWGIDPVVSRFVDKGTRDQLVTKAHQDIQDATFVTGLQQTVRDKGLDAALEQLSARKDITPEQRQAFENDVVRQDNLEQSNVNQQVLQKATDLTGQGMSIYDAVRTASAAVSPIRSAKAQEAATGYLNGQQAQFDQSLLTQVSSYRVGDASDPSTAHTWTQTLNWFMDPKSGFVTKASGRAYQEEISYIEARISEENSGASANVADTIPPALHMVATDPNRQAADKTQIFRQAYSDGWKDPKTGQVIKISGRQLDYLDSHRVDNETTLSSYDRIIASWSDVNPVTGATMMPREQAALAQMMLDDEYRRLLAKGPVSDKDLQDSFNQIKGFFADGIINKALNKQFMVQSAFLPFISFTDEKALNEIQGKIQRGELSHMVGSASFTPTLDELRKGQQGILAGKLKGDTVAEAATLNTGQQIFYTQLGNIYAQTVDNNGRAVWHAIAKEDLAKHPDPSIWPVVKL